MSGDPHPDRPGAFSYRVQNLFPERSTAVWMDGEYVGTADEVELRSLAREVADAE